MRAATQVVMASSPRAPSRSSTTGEHPYTEGDDDAEQAVCDGLDEGERLGAGHERPAQSAAPTQANPTV